MKTDRSLFLILLFWVCPGAVDLWERMRRDCIKRCIWLHTAWNVTINHNVAWECDGL